MTTTRRLRRVERELRGRAHRGDIHGAAIRAWLAARDLLQERGCSLPPPEQRPGGGGNESRSEARRRTADDCACPHAFPPGAKCWAKAGANAGRVFRSSRLERACTPMPPFAAARGRGGIRLLPGPTFWS
jgi:hypothetical protein